MMMPAENIVSKDFYPAENIKTISIELSYENLEIKTTNGSDILVEIASNNSKKRKLFCPFITRTVKILFLSI
jgi:hypothetical protein